MVNKNYTVDRSATVELKYQDITLNLLNTLADALSVPYYAEVSYDSDFDTYTIVTFAWTEKISG